jgi:hypothetical protein
MTSPSVNSNEIVGRANDAHDNNLDNINQWVVLIPLFTRIGQIAESKK